MRQPSGNDLEGNVHMRNVIAANLLGMLLLIASCGGGKTPSGITGNWTASLQSPGGAEAFGFTAELTQNSGASVAVSNFVLSPSNSCFTGQTVESATFSGTGNSSGPFGMTITSQSSPSDVLTIQGNLLTDKYANQSITGTWTLTGTSGCSGNGNFVMDPLPPV